MIKFYVTQIKLGKMTLADVPAKYRDKVAQALAEMV